MSVMLMSAKGKPTALTPEPGSAAVDVAMLCSACASGRGCHSIGAASANGVCARMSSHVSCVGSESDDALLLLVLLVPQSSDCHCCQPFRWLGCWAVSCGSPLTPAVAETRA